MRFVSTQYPELRFHLGDTSVKFHDGAAEVTDPDLIEQLHRYEHLGIEPADEGDHPDDDENPQDDAHTEGDESEDHESEGDESEDESDPAGGDPEGDTPVDRSDWSEEQLRAFAAEHNIDLGKLQNLEKIRNRITEALAAE